MHRVCCADIGNLRHLYIFTSSAASSHQNEITSAWEEIRSQSISWVITLVVTSDTHIRWRWPVDTLNVDIGTITPCHNISCLQPSADASPRYPQLPGRGATSWVWGLGLTLGGWNIPGEEPELRTIPGPGHGAVTSRLRRRESRAPEPVDWWWGVAWPGSHSGAPRVGPTSADVSTGAGTRGFSPLSLRSPLSSSLSLIQVSCQGPSSGPRFAASLDLRSSVEKSSGNAQHWREKI